LQNKRYATFQKENFAIDLNSQINDLSISFTSTEEQFENSINILHNVINKHAPIRKKKKKKTISKALVNY